MNAKVPTNNLSTERKVLNLLLNSEFAIDQALSLGLCEDDFSIARHRDLFNVISDIYMDQMISVGEDIDVIIGKIQYDNEDDKKQTILTINKLSKLMLKGNQPVPAKMLPSYVKELKDLNLTRRIIRGVQDIISELGNETATVQDLLLSVESLNTVTYENSASSRMLMKDAVNEAVKELIEEAETDNRIKFYIDELDKSAKIPRGYVTYVAGSPGVGKSAVLLNMANSQSSNGVRILYVSPEMTIADNMKRIFSMREGIVSQKLMHPKLMKSKDWKTIEKMLEDGILSNIGIYWLSSSDIDIKELEMEIKKYVKLYDIDVVMIDYYQLLSFDKDQDLPDGVRIPRVSRALNIMAGRKYSNPQGTFKQISIIALAQLNKEVEYRDDKHPTMYDLFYGGHKDARLVVGIYRDEYYNPEETTKPNIMEFGVIKQNNGIMNVWYDFHYDMNTYLLRELSSEEKELIDEEGDDDE